MLWITYKTLKKLHLPINKLANTLFLQFSKHENKYLENHCPLKEEFMTCPVSGGFGAYTQDVPSED